MHKAQKVKVSYLNDVNNISGSTKIPKKKINELIKKLSIKVNNGFILFSDYTKLLDHLEITYQIDPICFVKEKVLYNHFGIEDKEEKPVIAVMGHINHGKTTLISKMLNKSVDLTKQEEYKITQAISVYDGKNLFFIDTPGHSVFRQTKEAVLAVTDHILLVISLQQGVEVETEETIKFITQNNMDQYTTIVFTKSDLAKYSVDSLMETCSKKGLLVNYFEFKDFDDAYSRIKKAKRKAKEYCLYILNNQQNQIGECYLVFIHLGNLKTGNFICTETKVARVTKVFGLDMKQKQSVKGECFVFIQTDVRIASEEQAWIVTDSLQAENYGRILYYDQLIHSSPKETVGIGMSDPDIAILTHDNITKNIVEKMTHKYNVNKRSVVLCRLDKDLVNSMIQKTIVTFNFNIPEEYKKSLLRNKNEIKELNNIYQFEEFLSENNSCVLENNSIKNLSIVLKIFNIKNQRIAGVKIIKGGFSMHEKVKITVQKKVIQNKEQFITDDSVEAQIVSLKQKDKFLKKTKINTEVGIIFKQTNLEISEGAYIYS